MNNPIYNSIVGDSESLMLHEHAGNRPTGYCPAGLYLIAHKNAHLLIVCVKKTKLFSKCLM